MNCTKNLIPSAWELGDSVSKEVLLELYEKDCLFPKTIPKKKGIRVMTYNVHLWYDPLFSKINYDKMIRDIKKLNPDVLALQEVLLPIEGTKILSDAGWGLK